MISAVPIKFTYDSHEKVVFHFKNVLNTLNINS